jgi:Xaa-Pro aminopeptidase
MLGFLMAVFFLNVLFIKKGVLNLRGSDIDYNPVFKSYLYLDFSEKPYKGTLFIDSAKVSSEVGEYLTANHIEVQPYEAVFQTVSSVT